MEHNKFYVGKVIYNEDPTFSGRCKVRVFGMFDGLDDKFIPWFAPANSGIYSTKGGGSLSVPKLGDIVRVNFSNNDLYSGEYSSLQYLDPDLINEIKDDYLGTHVLLFDSEAELMVLYQEKTGFKIYHKGSRIIIDPDGMIQAKNANNNCVIEIKDSGITIATAAGGGNEPTGTINISSANSVNITAPNVNVNANKVNLCNGANQPAVKGKTLQGVLMEMAVAIDNKYPKGVECSTKNFASILSNKVNLE